MKKQIVIIGAGGFGRELVPIIEKKYRIKGFVDDIIKGNVIGKYDVIGDVNWLLAYQNKINAVIAIANPINRKKIYDKLSQNTKINFPNIISDFVINSKYNKFGIGNIICNSTIMTVNVQVKNFCIINLDCTIGHEAILNDFVTLYPSVNVSGNVEIGSCTEIGTGTNIIQKLHIGENSIIGAGSVVIKDIPKNCTAVGVPAKPIKYRE